MGRFSKKSQVQGGYGEPPITIGSAELVNAAALIEQFERSLGNSNATWAALDAIARRGGFVSIERMLTEIVAQRVSVEVAIDGPWRWWATASTIALNKGDNLFPARIFMFTKLFIMQMVPNMNAATQADLGLGKPADETHRIIASNGAAALAQLPPNYLIHDTATARLTSLKRSSWREKTPESDGRSAGN